VEFAKLINHPQPSNTEVEIMDPMDWDSKGQYNKLLEAVRQASQGNDVRVYRVTWDKTRVEYWLITRADGRIVGAKALAVES
jgi:outer membrane lipopolysaccharide assembly protein LptE/RlpB